MKKNIKADTVKARVRGKKPVKKPSNTAYDILRDLQITAERLRFETAQISALRRQITRHVPKNGRWIDVRESKLIAGQIYVIRRTIGRMALEPVICTWDRGWGWEPCLPGKGLMPSHASNASVQIWEK